jgi:hypothetical protein
MDFPSPRESLFRRQNYSEEVLHIDIVPDYDRPSIRPIKLEVMSTGVFIPQSGTTSEQFTDPYKKDIGLVSKKLSELPKNLSDLRE